LGETTVLEAAAGETNTGIGRIASLEDPVSLELLVDRVKQALGLSFARYSGDEEKVISRVAVITGSGQSFFSAAALGGAECIITGDTTYHHVSDLREEGIAVIDAGHFGTEWPALKVFSKWFQNRIAGMGFGNSVVLAESVSCPYKCR